MTGWPPSWPISSTPTLLVLLSDVDALYDAPPSRPGATASRVVRGPHDLDHVESAAPGPRSAAAAW